MSYEMDNIENPKRSKAKLTNVDISTLKTMVIICDFPNELIR